jgi:hypothetical protein
LNRRATELTLATAGIDLANNSLTGSLKHKISRHHLQAFLYLDLRSAIYFAIPLPLELGVNDSPFASSIFNSRTWSLVLP